VVNDRSVSFEFQELYKVFPRITNECDKKHDNLVVISYEDDQQCIHITEDRGIEDCHSNFSSHISCFELLFQEEICSHICSKNFEDCEHTLVEVPCFF